MVEAIKRGRPPKGTRRGKPLTIYVSESREQLFQSAYKHLDRLGKLPSTVTYNQARTHIIDYALDALIEKLEGQS